jgi:DNA polymerase-3 subunit alpha
MDQVEELGLLKLDVLCLRNLDLIGDTVQLVNGSGDVDLEIDEIPLDDEATFDLFTHGDLGGVFQFESRGMPEATRLVEPTEFDDLTAVLSLCRPGAMAFLPAYAQGKAEPDSVDYRDPRLKEIFGSTYGCFVYQEQVMAMCEKMAGFSLSEANEFRILIGRRQRNARFHELNTGFLDGLGATGTNQAVIEFLESEVWEAAGYTFNKAHAACYALIAYRTAYLKANYPAEFNDALDRL